MPFIKQFSHRSSITTFASAVFFSIGLAACGGGGGGSEQNATSSSSSNSADNQPPADNSSTPNTPPADNSSTTENSTSKTLLPANPVVREAPDAAAGNDLMISEVGSNYYTNDVTWLEVHNPTDRAIGLSAYTLRSSSVDLSNNASSFSPVSFELPSIDVPARGYVVIAGKVYDKLLNNRQMVYVRNGSVVPYWNASGSVELVSGGKTIDFVRFGTSTSVPVTGTEWSGENVGAMPSGPNEHGKSIVRLASGGMADSNSARDWSMVNFATPAGRNDVQPGVIDSDRDGIPDSAKEPGKTYAGLDLYAMGARRGQRDLFIEIDYMRSTDPGVTPRREALKKMVDAFAQKNIAVHIDTGNLYAPTFDPAQFNLGGGESVEFAQCIELAAASEVAKPGCGSFYEYKSRHFDVRRKLLFHYTVFANSQNLDGSAGSSGIAEVNGNDLIVSMGNYGFNTIPGSGLNMLINLQASTLMHELGHNLGLLHGGNENTNYKPNHYSVMNYMYQFAGLSATPNSPFAAERYYLANNLKGKTYCNLVENSPCSESFKLDYSDGKSMDLDEHNLLESANIGRGSTADAYADWNNDGVRTLVSVARNLNPQDGSARSVLRDYNEWNNIMLPFARGYSGSNTGRQLHEEKVEKRANPMNHLPKHRIKEEPLPVQLHLEIRHSHKGRH